MKQIDPCNGLKIGTQKIKFRLLNFADGIFFAGRNSPVYHIKVIQLLQHGKGEVGFIFGL